MWFQSKYAFPNILPPGRSLEPTGKIGKSQNKETLPRLVLALAKPADHTLLCVGGENYFEDLDRKKISFTSVSRHV